MMAIDYDFALVSCIRESSCNTMCAFFIVAVLCVRQKNETGFPRSVRDAGNADTNYNLVKLLQAREHIYTNVMQ